MDTRNTDPQTESETVERKFSSNQGTKKRRWIGWLIVVFLAGGVAALFLWQPDEQEGNGRPGGRPGGGKKAVVSVRAAQAELSSVALKAIYRGELDADAADISSDLAGRLLEVPVRLGDRVEKGQLLARLDVIEWRRQLEEAKAQALSAKASWRRSTAQLQAAQQELERNNKLLGDQLVSRQQIETLQARVESFEADLEASKAQDSQARARIALFAGRVADGRITAPFAGKIVDRLEDPGTYVQPGQGIVRIVADGDLRVRFEVPEAEIIGVQLKARFEVHLSAAPGTIIEGTVTGIASEVDRDRRVVSVEGQLDGRPAGWLPGMYAEITMVRAVHRDVIVVPAVSIVDRLEADGTEIKGLFRVSQGEEAKSLWTPVKILGREQDRVAISGKVSAGDQVLISGHENLADQAKIRIVPNEDGP